MSEYNVDISWNRDGQNFVDNRYSRLHTWRFDGGLEVPASSSPGVVPLPYSDSSAVDPEEAFIASLSSCHMLWFLNLAAQKGFRIDRYTDHAVGTMGKNAAGKIAMLKVLLQPKVDCSGERLPSTAELSELHDSAHEQCFLASSVKTEVLCEPQY